MEPTKTNMKKENSKKEKEQIMNKHHEKRNDYDKKDKEKDRIKYLIIFNI